MQTRANEFSSPVRPDGEVGRARRGRRHAFDNLKRAIKIENLRPRLSKTFDSTCHLACLPLDLVIRLWPLSRVSPQEGGHWRLC
jgi:hypothetical protein